MENIHYEDILIRSRITILDMLEGRGYDVQPYRKMTGPDLVKLMTDPDALQMTVTMKEDPSRKAIVTYTNDNIKTRVGSGEFVRKLLDTTTSPEEEKRTGKYMLTGIDPTTTEVIVIYRMTDKMDKSQDKAGQENTDSFDKAALEAWSKHKFKVQFFPINRLVNNPLNHVLQPKFESVPAEEVPQLMKNLCVTTKAQFPIIKFHNDPVARFLGLIPEQIVRITAPSPTAGQYVKYRVCAP